MCQYLVCICAYINIVDIFSAVNGGRVVGSDGMSMPSLSLVSFLLLISSLFPVLQGCCYYLVITVSDCLVCLCAVNITVTQFQTTGCWANYTASSLHKLMEVVIVSDRVTDL